MSLGTRKIGRKVKESKRHVEHYQVDKHTNYGVPGEERNR